MTAQTITPSMPEPKEYGSFLIATSAGKPLFIAHHRRSESARAAWSDIEMDDCSWSELVACTGGWTIESLAARDARIRREALDLTDAEAHAALDVWNDVVDAFDGGPIAMRQVFAAVAERREQAS